MNDIKTELKTRAKLVNAALEEYLPERDNAQSVIYRAMRYSLFAGGKRLRPILMLECTRLFGGDWDDVKPLACAIEMIHTYSLIHDDLPAMDNDDLRRGMPTNHKKFGEDIAILAGDALLTKAFETALLNGAGDFGKTIKALGLLACASGAEGMIGGQVLDLAAEGEQIGLSELRHIHELKTGALISAACVIGAAAADAGEPELNMIRTFAENLGIAFQIRDDILDVEGNEAELGKPIGSDAAEEKNTYVTLAGLVESRRLVGEYSAGAKAALSGFGESAGFLLRLTDYLTDRNN